MTLLRSIRNVVTNLAEGRDPTDVRPEQNSVPSAAFISRLQAVNATDRFLTEAVKPRLPPALCEPLDRAVAHLEEPIGTTQQLLVQVQHAARCQRIAVGRADWPLGHPEQVYAEDLESLEAALSKLLIGDAEPNAKPAEGTPSAA